MLTFRVMLENGQKFIDALAESLQKGSFVKLTLGNYKGREEHLQKLLVRLVATKKGSRLYFLYRYETRDTAKNFDVEKGVSMIEKAFSTGFRSGHLFTTEHDYQLELGKKGKSRLNIGKATFNTAQVTSHDREKKEQIDPNSFYLRSLGITDDNGRVRDREQNKWKQINKFVEVLASLIDKSELKTAKNLRIVDMGSGKGYLTFAAYDFLKNVRDIDVSMTGVDTKTELVELGNGIAAAAGFDSLEFVRGTIGEYDVAKADILIALHACNTATDDALFKGIRANASLIVVAPCCHQELRPQIKPPEMFKDILKHGVMLERTAETLTDGLRSLLLEREGYSTKLFEFIGVEHTPKNNMLVGSKSQASDRSEAAEDQIRSIMSEFGISHQKLRTLLDS